MPLTTAAPGASALLAVLVHLAPALARTITVTNSCAQTVWPGLHTGAGDAPAQATGWELAPGATTSLAVPDTWTAGRVWARTGCATTGDGTFQCLTGGCGAGTDGEVTCSGTDQPPATLAEFTLAPAGDNYDVSLVDGFNVPLTITPGDGSCEAPACASNINALCPAILRTGIDESGVNYACAHACNAGFGEETYGNRACCSGGYADAPPLCEACGVDFYDLFKDNCNSSYAYAYDEKSGTALWTCASAPDYAVEFCPGGTSFEGSSNDDVPTAYDGATATCSSMLTAFSVTYAVSASPTSAQTSGTLEVVATNAATVGGQAAIGVQTAALESASAAAAAAAMASSAASEATATASAAMATASAAATSAGPAGSSDVWVETDFVVSTSTVSAVGATAAATSASAAGAAAFSSASVSSSAGNAWGGDGAGGGALDLAVQSSGSGAASAAATATDTTNTTNSTDTTDTTDTCRGGARLTAVPGKKRRAAGKRKHARGRH